MDLTCSKCHLVKDVTSFYKDKHNPRGYTSSCSLCRSAYQKANKIKRNDWYRLYRQKNAKSLKLKRKEYLKKTLLKRREYRKLYERKMRQENPLYKAINNLRNRIKSALKRFHISKNNGKTSEYLIGCSLQDFTNYIEKQFKPEMSWSNYGYYWHIDHITPLSWAKSESELIQLLHYTNCQPLEAIANIRKGNRYA